MAQDARISSRVPAAPSGSRENKIAALKKAIAEGIYHVNSADIAEKMIKEALIEALLSRSSAVQLKKDPSD